MVVTQIGVGQDVVADGLAGAQAAAVADHHPGVRTGDGQVVADGLGVRRPDPDVDQGDALTVRPRQMIGGHLMAAPGGVHDGAFRIGGLAVDDHAAGARQGLIDAGRIGQLGAGPAHELIDVAMIVGEQDIGLHVLDRGAGVVAQAGQREVGAQAVELGQGEVLARREQAVRDLVADVGQVRGREPARDRGRHGAVQRHAGTVQHIGEGDFLIRRLDRDGGAVLGDQQAQLLQQIIAVQVGAGDGRRIDAGARQAGEGPRLQVLRTVAEPADGQSRIGEQAGGPGFGIGALAGLEEALHCGSQIGDGLIVEGFEAVQRRLGGHLVCHDFL
ncbi:hypothetical protein D3C85_1067250 [compost metagenome]